MLRMWSLSSWRSLISGKHAVHLGRRWWTDRTASPLAKFLEEPSRSIYDDKGHVGDFIAGLWCSKILVDSGHRAGG